MIKRKNCLFYFLFLLFLFSTRLAFSNEKTMKESSGLLEDIVLSKTQNSLVVKVLFSPNTLYRFFELSDHNRVVIDLFNLVNIKSSRYIVVNDFGVSAIRVGMFKPDVVRVVFDIEQQIPFYKIEKLHGELKVLFFIKGTSGDERRRDDIKEIARKKPEVINQTEEEIKSSAVEEKKISDELEKKEKEITETTDETLEDKRDPLKEVVSDPTPSQTQPAIPREQVDRQPKPNLDNITVGKRIAQAAFLDRGSVKIDGKVEEISWENASVLTDFTQHEPDEGAPATEDTKVTIFYNEDSVYIGVRAFDSEPDKIKSILARRDSELPSDWIRIFIDGYHDQLTAFEFAVNPAGVKRDVYWSNDNESDVDWEAVWDVEVSQDEQGWNAEFRIPYSQIRFPEKEFQTWGIQVCRVIARKNETSYWCHVPKGEARFVSLFGDLTGITGVPSPKRLQILPYSMGRSSFLPQEEGNPFQQGSDYLANMGLNLKYGLTSNLTLDAAFNPDFGQVEVDPADVNLTVYETYFPEKRPFFIEGKNMLSFPLGASTGRESLFYSRRVGRAPQGDPSSAQYFHKPENTTILGALKLVGKTAQGWSIGLMEALTERERAEVVSWEGERKQEAVEPLTNFFLGRVEKEFREGRSAFGMIFTAVNRKIEDTGLNFLRRAAYAGGLRFRHRWAKDTHEIKGGLIGSHILGSKEAILEAQQSSVRYFQRPDATHMEVDPDRTSLSGYSSNFSLSKIGGGHWRWSVTGMVRSPGFEVNDMGYIRYSDWVHNSVRMSYNKFKPGKIFRDYNISLSMSNSWDYALVHLERRISLRINSRVLNYWNLNANLIRARDHFKTDLLRGGPAVITPGSWSAGGSFNTDPRKDFFFRLQGNIQLTDDGSKTFRLSSAFDFRPFSNLHLSLSPGINDNQTMLQYVTKKTVDDQTHYILSRLDRTTVSMTLRFNYTLTSNLSLQLYCEPYVSAGRYSEFKEAIQPLAKKYEDRWHVFKNQEISLQNDYYYLYMPWAGEQEVSFSNPDFNFRQFRLNFVVRWEYLPGSNLFLVWSNGMNSETDVANLSLGNDLQSLFRSPSSNIFLIKISYWFNI